MTWIDKVLPRVRAVGELHPHPSTPRARRRYAAPPLASSSAPPGPVADAAALAHFRGLWRTAEPGRVAQAHSEAFAQLSREQRHGVLGRLSPDDPEGPGGPHARIRAWADRLR